MGNACRRGDTISNNTRGGRPATSGRAGSSRRAAAGKDSRQNSRHNRSRKEPSPVPVYTKEIDARWGEEESQSQYMLCTEYVPNPFKAGFCGNCQRQHNTTDGGGVEEVNISNKIVRAPVSKTAANAENNPQALKNIRQQKSKKGSSGRRRKQRSKKGGRSKKNLSTNAADTEDAWI